MDKKSITREDVARHAGVSTAVVSYVINDGPRPTSEKTRKKVLAAIDELGYRVNEVARSLRSKKSHTWGLLIPDTSNSFYSEVAQGIEEKAFDNGYNTIVCHTGGSESKQLDYLNILISRMVDGVIFITSHVQRSHLKLIAENDVPFILIDPENDIEHKDNYFGGVVKVDGKAGGYLAGEYLFLKGRKNLFCISGPKKSLSARNRTKGFIKAANNYNFHPGVVWSGENCEAGYRATQELINSKKPLSGIFTCNDLLAIGSIRALNDNGFLVPEDVAVIGFDDITLSEFIQPRLTTIRQPKLKMGQLAADMLVNAMGHKENDEFYWETKTLSIELIIRESV